MSARTYTTLLLLVCTGTALAQAPADVDGDGRVSRQEFEQRAAERFVRLDRNGDGYLDRDEMRRIRSERGPGPGGGWRGADADGDGAISLAELEAVRPGVTPERFAELDTNGDGLLTPDERPRRR